MSKGKKKKESSGSLNFTQKGTVVLPQIESNYGIKESDWSRLKDDIKQIPKTKVVYGTISNLCFGFFLSSLGVYFTVPDLQYIEKWDFHYYIFFTLTAVFLVAGILCFIFDSQQKKSIEISADYIIAQMDKIEGRFKKLDE